MMRMVDMIRKKRDGGEHSPGEIKWMVDSFVRDEIPDYQITAWLMAVYYKGLTPKEQSELTTAMAYSGETLDLSSIPGIKVDKHSTGGVGDKTTLLLAPLVAAAGIPVIKMSGRGLGHTGGTVDKLESIPGFSVSLTLPQALAQAKAIGAVLAGQTGHLVPADKKLYSLRDVTATVENTALIAASVMSKKIAAGADAIVLDVKVGNGAFISDMSGAEELARAMVSIGKEAGKSTVAVISDMNQPLGLAVGNALEVQEVIRALAGDCPQDLKEICLCLGSYMLLLGGRCKTLAEAEKVLSRVWREGKGLRKFEEIVRYQGGPAGLCARADEILPRAAYTEEITASRDGWVAEIDTFKLGLAASKIGAGRKTINDNILPETGLTLSKKTGSSVLKGDALCTIHAASAADAALVREEVRAAFQIAEKAPRIPRLIKKVITATQG